MRRVVADFLATSAEFFHPQVSDPGFGQGLFQRFAIEMRQAPRHGKRTDVDQRLYRMGSESFKKFVECAGGMADGVESGHGEDF